MEPARAFRCCRVEPTFNSFLGSLANRLVTVPSLTTKTNGLKITRIQGSGTSRPFIPAWSKPMATQCLRMSLTGGYLDWDIVGVFGSSFGCHRPGSNELGGLTGLNRSDIAGRLEPMRGAVKNSSSLLSMLLVLNFHFDLRPRSTTMTPGTKAIRLLRFTLKLQGAAMCVRDQICIMGLISPLPVRGTSKLTPRQYWIVWRY